MPYRFYSWRCYIAIAIFLVITGVFVVYFLNPYPEYIPGKTGIKIPSQHDWTDRGVVLLPGIKGTWDLRLNGMISPCSVVKKEGTYFLYYIGADGSRSTDGGPRHRALGVATSTDGFHFNKYVGNPIITYLPHNNEEEGVFSAGATLDENGDVILYYGAMDAGNSTSELVNCDIRLAISKNGLDFKDLGMVVSHSDSSVWGYGDELSPVGTFKTNGTWFVYYIVCNGIGAKWDLGLAWGPKPDNLPDSKKILKRGSYIIGGCDPVKLRPDKIGFFIVRDFPTRIVETRIAFIDSLDTVSAPVETYDFPDFRHATVFLDHSTKTWFMYYLNGAGDAINVKTAPMTIFDTTSSTTADRPLKERM